MAPFAHLVRAVALSSALEPRGFTYRDNSVQFVGQPLQQEWWIRSGEFRITDLSVTDGQDPDPQNRVGDVKSFTVGQAGKAGDQSFNFKVGRKGSNKVANWWNNNFPANRNTFQKAPGDLNFAFKGDLKLQMNDQLTIYVPNIGLGQGHVGAYNNWWFGGSNCEAVAFEYAQTNYAIRCPGTNQAGATIHVIFKRGYDVAERNEIRVHKIEAY